MSKHKLEQCFYLTVVLVTSLSLAQVEDKHPLYVLVTAPYPHPITNTGWAAGISLIPAVRLAFEQINNNSDILRSYELILIERDSGCRSGNTIPLNVFSSFISGRYYNQLEGDAEGDADRRYYNSQAEDELVDIIGSASGSADADRQYYNSHTEDELKNIVGIIGSACSDVAIALAPLIARPQINMLQIAPTANSPRIETSNFNTTFTMLSSSLAYVESIAQLIECIGWSNIGVIFDGLAGNFKTTNGRFIERLRPIISFNSPVYDINDGDVNILSFNLNELKETRVRIIVVFGGDKIAQKIMCLAYKFNMIFPNHQWIFSERSIRDFKKSVENFEFNGQLYQCSESEIGQAADGSILNKYSLILEEGNISVTSQNYSTYRNQYEDFFTAHSNEPKVQRILNATGNTIESYMPSGIWENTYYDAGLALGLALDQLSMDGYNLSSYKTGMSNFTQLLSSKLLDVSFTGATGPVKFNRLTRSVQTTIFLSQLYRTNTSGLIEVPLTKYAADQSLQCTGNRFISDRFEVIPIHIHSSVGIIMLFFTIILALLLVLLHTAFVLWSSHRSIKASSPNLSYLIFSGCYLFSLATVIHTVQEAFLTKYDVVYPVLCSAVMWCLMLGSSLIFGTIFVRVWRVFRLFKHFRNKSPGILLHDNALICGVIMFIAVDVVVCILWIVYSPWTLVQTTETTQNSQAIYIRSSCTCQDIEYWTAGVAIYKGGIAILLVIFSVLNRKIQRKHFSHTKKVNVLVYSLTVLGGIGFPLYFLLKDINIHLSYLNICAFFLITVTLCCVLMFIPPVFPVLKTKLGLSDELTISQGLKRIVTYSKDPAGSTEEILC